ncbi:MAG TPA: family 78 glycoside hydrolase catalytic domain [Streptosporangiaceae bacterium]|nr:family 78 glycoside hydrolase catalytic domain [Streptosporangiaceae bacterium]
MTSPPPASPTGPSARLRPAGLRCAHLTDPLGVAPDRVRFGWRLEGTGHQAAYQLQVTRSEAGRPEAPAWDSGRVESAESTGIAYGGSSLARGGRYTWRVRVWDLTGRASALSDPAVFEVELDPSEDWRASWIGLGPIRESFTPPVRTGPPDQVANALRSAPYLRRAFQVSQPVLAARLYVTALGLYEARINGRRVGDACLAPGWTDYGQRIHYQAYDVTGLLTPGENVLGAIIADGWYSGFIGFDAKRAGALYGQAPELLAQLVITLADGSRQWVATDEHWRAAFAAIRHADLLMGERHDLGLEPRGWDAPGYEPGDFDGRSGWRPVRCQWMGGRRVLADPGPPVRVTEELAPVSVTRRGDRHIIDFGQNLTGWVRLRAAGPAGTTIRVRHGEALDAGGEVYTDNLRTARAVDEYTLDGEPAVLEPRFTWHGFRYAEISGYPGDLDGDLDPGDLVARVVHSDIPATGSVSASAVWLEQLARAIDWGQRGNFISVPTDCPQRDERLGWLGDAQVFARTACYNRDVSAFFAKWLQDVADAQHPSGAFSDIAPRASVPWAGAPGWADGGVIVPWTVWKMYGDPGVLERHLDSMTRWMDYLERVNPDHVRSRELGNSYNDWLTPGPDDTPPELVGTAYWAYDAALMAEIAEVLGRPGDAAGYRALGAKVGAAFSEAFVSAGGRLASGTQTAYVLALHAGLVPGELRSAAAGHLVEAIRAADWHLTTGYAGVGQLLPVLSATGHTDVAYRLLEQDTAPSWRYMISSGATTMWERWDGWTAEHGFQSAWMNSLNHYAFGSVGDWLYRFLLGIDQAPGTAGFSHPVLRPHPGGSLTFARGSYDSVRGPISAGWERSGDQLSYQVELPPNVTAAVCMPAGPGAEETTVRVGPGRHEFTGRWPG